MDDPLLNADDNIEADQLLQDTYSGPVLEPLTSSNPKQLIRTLTSIPPSVPPSARSLLSLTFISLGASSSITLSTLCLAVSYFSDDLGEGVVGALITCHCAAVLLVMSIVLVALPAKLSSRTSSRILSLSILEATLFNGFALLSVINDHPLKGSTLYPLAALNGVATGLIQTMSSRLGGDLPTTAASQLGSLQLVGVGLAQWLPGLVQASLISLASRDARAAARLGAKISLAISLAVCAAAFVLLRLLLFLHEQHLKATADNAVDKHERTKNIGHVLRKSGGAMFIWRSRAAVLGPAFALLFSAEASNTVLVVLAARLPLSATASEFWIAEQATLLLMAANACAFVGRLLGLRAEPSLGISPRILLWWSAAPASATAAGLYAAGVVPPSFGSPTPVAFYALASLVNGYALVLINKSGQAGLKSERTGRHDIQWNPCPVAAQLVWFALQTGAFVPALLSNFI